MYIWETNSDTYSFVEVSVAYHLCCYFLRIYLNSKVKQKASEIISSKILNMVNGKTM